MSEVPKSHVLTLKWVMRPPTPEDSMEGPEIPADHDHPGRARTRPSQSDHPVRVVEDGKVVGIVDDDAILRVVVAEEGAGMSTAATTRVTSFDHGPRLTLRRNWRAHRHRRGDRRLGWLAYWYLAGQRHPGDRRCPDERGTGLAAPADQCHLRRAGDRDNPILNCDQLVRERRSTTSSTSSSG